MKNIHIATIVALNTIECIIWGIPVIALLYQLFFFGIDDIRTYQIFAIPGGFGAVLCFLLIWSNNCLKKLNKYGLVMTTSIIAFIPVAVFSLYTFTHLSNDLDFIAQITAIPMIFGISLADLILVLKSKKYF